MKKKGKAKLNNKVRRPSRIGLRKPKLARAKERQSKKDDRFKELDVRPRKMGTR